MAEQIIYAAPRQNTAGTYTDANGNTVAAPTGTGGINPALIRSDWVSYYPFGGGVVGFDKYGRVELRGFTGNVLATKSSLLTQIGTVANAFGSVALSLPIDNLIAIRDVVTTGYAGKLTFGTIHLKQIFAGLSAGSSWNTEVMRFVDAYSDPNSIFYRGDTANPADPNYQPGEKINDVPYQNPFLAETAAAKAAQGAGGTTSIKVLKEIPLWAWIVLTGSVLYYFKFR